MVRSIIVTLIATVVFVSSAAAQEPVPVDSFARLPERVKTGTTVFVIDEKGERTKGKITFLSAASLQLATSGWRERQVTFPADRVWHVTRVDSRLNGFLIGSVAGAVSGILIGIAFNSYCTNEAGPCPEAMAIFGAPIGLLGGWIGYGIDGLINGQQLVYSRKSATPPGVRFSFRF